MKDRHIILVTVLCDNEAYIVNTSLTINYVVNVHIVYADNLYIYISLTVMKMSMLAKQHCFFTSYLAGF